MASRASPGAEGSGRTRPAAATAVPEHVPGQVAVEHSQGGQHEPGHAVRVRTRAVAAQAQGTAQRQGFADRRVQRFPTAGAVGERGQGTCEAEQTPPARRAPARRLPGQVRCRSCQLGQREAFLAEHEHRALPQGAAEGLQSRPADRHFIGGRTCQPASVVPADQHALRGLCSAHAEHVTEPPSRRDLDDCGPGYRPGHSQQHRAGLGWVTSRGVPLGPEHAQHRKLRERLRVAQQGRPPPQPAVAGVGPARRGQRRARSWR